MRRSEQFIEDKGWNQILLILTWLALKKLNVYLLVCMLLETWSYVLSLQFFSFCLSVWFLPRTIFRPAHKSMDSPLTMDRTLGEADSLTTELARLIVRRIDCSTRTTAASVPGSTSFSPLSICRKQLDEPMFCNHANSFPQMGSDQFSTQMPLDITSGQDDPVAFPPLHFDKAYRPPELKDLRDFDSSIQQNDSLIDLTDNTAEVFPTQQVICLSLKVHLQVLLTQSMGVKLIQCPEFCLIHLSWRMTVSVIRSVHHGWIYVWIATTTGAFLMLIWNLLFHQKHDLFNFTRYHHANEMYFLCQDDVMFY